MNILPGNAYIQGKRQSQQDAFGFSQLEDTSFVTYGGYLAVVCDGIGGLEHGQEASNTAVDTMLKQYMTMQKTESVSDALDRALSVANTAVVDLAKRYSSNDVIGTTLLAVVIKENTMHWRAVGDSHIYLYRNEKLFQINTVHTYSNQLTQHIAQGEMTYSEAQQHPQRDSLVSFIGQENLQDIDANKKPFPLRHGDKILLCTDGIYNSLAISEMETCLQYPPMEAAELLCVEVEKKEDPLQDNATALVLFYPGQSQPPVKKSFLGRWKLW